MSSFIPKTAVRSNLPLIVNRGNALRYVYNLSMGKTFPVGTTSVLTVSNTYGQLVGAYVGTVLGGQISFVEGAAIANTLTRSMSWTLTVTYPGDSEVTMLAQGIVVRDEAPYPDAPPQSSAFDGVSYQYSFGTTGFVVDPSWRIMNGNPQVYDNSASSLPNAVAAGSLLGGDLAVYDDVAMLWFAPLNNDPVRLTYNTIRSGAGSMCAVICSNYDMTNYAAFKHTGVFLSGVFQHDTVQVVTGSGPVTTVGRGTAVDHVTNSNENYTAEYNPLTNTFNLYLGTSLSPITSWPDTTNVVQHGAGERYVGFGFKSDLLTPGVEVSDWIIGDTP